METEIKKETLIEKGLRLGYLKNKKVFLKPIEGKRLTLTPASGESIHAFMYEGAVYDRCLPMNEKLDYFNPFESEDERLFFEEMIGKDLKPDPSNSKCVWNTGAGGDTGVSNTIKVKFNVDSAIKTTGYVFDLMMPYDVLRFKIAKMQYDTAPSWEARHTKDHYKFAIVDGQEEDLSKKVTAQLNINAYVAFGKIQDSKEKMIETLKLYYMQKKDFKDVSDNTSTNQLISELERIIEMDIKGFISVVNDPDKDIKILIINAVKVGAIVKEGVNSYTVDDSVRMKYDDLITFMKNAEAKKDDDDTYLRILARIDLANGGTIAKKAVKKA